MSMLLRSMARYWKKVLLYIVYNNNDNNNNNNNTDNNNDNNNNNNNERPPLIFKAPRALTAYSTNNTCTVVLLQIKISLL